MWLKGTRLKASLLFCSHQKLMTLMNPSRDEPEEEIAQMQTDVTDEEMALRYRHGDAGGRASL